MSSPEGFAELVAEIDWRPLWISLKVGVSATAVSIVAGSAIGYFLAHREFPGKRLALSFILLPLVLPPTVLGYYLLVIIGRRGFVGKAWESLFGGPLVFTIGAAIVAASLATIPIVARQLAAAFAETEHDVTEAARIDGASGFALFFFIHLPQIRGPLVAAATIAFARAIGDFGATLMVAGNIPGETQTAAIAIWDLMNAGKDEQALVLVVMMSAIAMVILFFTTGKSAKI